MEMSAKRAWDWTLAGLLVLVVLTAAVRLASTQWTDSLYFGESMGVIGACLGLALGASKFRAWTSRLLGLGYTLAILPYQLILLAEPEQTPLEKLTEIGLRLGVGLTTVYNDQSLDDPILFVTFITLTLWLVGLISGYRLARHHDTLTALLPSGLVILVVQIYDTTEAGRIWLFAFYLFLGLLLAGRVYYLENHKRWKEGRVFEMPETARDFARGLMLVSALVVLTAWSLPLSLDSLRSAAEFWRDLTRPLRPIKEDISLALDPLDAPSDGANKQADFYAETMTLGRGYPLSNDVVFRMYAPEDLQNPPPRFYWRGRVFDTYRDNTWINGLASRQTYQAFSADLPIPDTATRETAVFVARNEVEQSLIYSPSQPVWTNQPGQMLFQTLPGDEMDLFAFQSILPILPRETYRVRAALVNPSIEELRNAPSDYPAWVTERYLQLPENFSPRIADLARQITINQATAYDQAAAITQWLRANIEYQPIIPAPPQNVDALEWVLFDYKRGFCMYDATGMVLMLRSLGVPARMAVGFAQGELDEKTNSYAVRRKNYHAWPEVYFTGIGWVEFEPTGNQEILVRPLTHAAASLSPLARPTPGPIPTPLDRDPRDRERDLADITPTIPWTTTYRSFIVWLSWTAILLALWGLNRLTGWVGRIPIYLESRLERSGRAAPGWIRAWAAWARLSPIGRAYETINLSLRMLGEPQPFYVTPAERARRLTSLVPAAQDRVRELTEAHERAAYALAASPVAKSRRAAAVILFTTIRARLIQLGSSLEERFSRPDSFR
jgi:transglutaminase-like putative cysteine protease